MEAELPDALPNGQPRPAGATGAGQVGLKTFEIGDRKGEFLACFFLGMIIWIEPKLSDIAPQWIFREYLRYYRAGFIHASGQVAAA